MPFVLKNHSKLTIMLQKPVAIIPAVGGRVTGAREILHGSQHNSYSNSCTPLLAHSDLISGRAQSEPEIPADRSRSLRAIVFGLGRWPKRWLARKLARSRRAANSRVTDRGCGGAALRRHTRVDKPRESHESF